MNALLRFLADDRDLITYRPKLNQLTGSVTATILLQQILYRWKNNGFEPFYKFKEPCKHRLYKPDDSWREELGFTRREVDTALSKIGQKLSKGAKKDPSAFVYYWTDMSRLTHYTINETALTSALEQLYDCAKPSPEIEIEEASGKTVPDTHSPKSTNQPLRKVQKRRYVKADSAFRKSAKAPLDNTETTKEDSKITSKSGGASRDGETHPKTPTTRGKEENQEEIIRQALGKTLYEQLLSEERWRRLWLELPLEAIAGAIAKAKRGYKNRHGTRLKDALDALIPIERRVSEVARRRERETAARRETLEREAQKEADAAPITDFAAMSEGEFERYNRRFSGALADVNRRVRVAQQAEKDRDREARSREQGEAARRYALAEQARQLNAGV